MEDQINYQYTFTIGLCDDEPAAHEIVKSLIRRYAKTVDVPCKLVTYSSGTELLQNYKGLDLLLLDIEMPNPDGIETAFRLRALGFRSKIIMLTAREDRYRDAFKIGAFRFVPKPIKQSELFCALDEAWQDTIDLSPVTVYRDHLSHHVVQADITFIEARRAETRIFTVYDEYRSEQSLRYWKQQLNPDRFFQCHRSVIVNLGMIDFLTAKTVHLISNEDVRVSNKLHDSLTQAYMEFHSQYH